MSQPPYRPGQYGEEAGPPRGYPPQVPPGQNPYYQQMQHPSPYGRGWGAQGYGGIHSPNPNDLAAARMYGQRPTQPYGYGGVPPPPPPHGQGSGTSPDQRYAHPPPPHHAYSQYYGRQPAPHEMYGQRPPDGSQGGVPPHHNPYAPQSSPTNNNGGGPSPGGTNRPSPTSRPSPSGMTGSAGSKHHHHHNNDGDDDEEDVDSNEGNSDKDDDDDDEEHHHAHHGGGSGHHHSKNLTSNDPEAQKWFHGSIPLGLEDDKYWLSELQVYLRSNFAEAFGATEEDIAAPMHGRNKPIAFGQVGIRCMHCKRDNPAERGQQATSYPSLISGIYNSVQQMLRLHLDCCLSMPPEIRQKIEQLKLSSSSRGGRKQYWIDSAKRLGLVDTPHGIHFGRDPHGPLPALMGPSVNSKEGRKKQAEMDKLETGNSEEVVEQPIPEVDPRPLVFEEDKPLISDFLYLTLEQMSPCKLMEADRVGCYKTRKVGFPGLACRHCVGQAGCGRYFPASEASLSQTTTSQTIMNHVRNCRRCPVDIRENLEIMKRARMGPDGKRADKPKHGGRKVFFHRLWCRIQDLPIQEEKGEHIKEEKKKKSPTKKAGKKKKADSDEESSGEETEEDSSDEESDRETGSPKAKGALQSPSKGSGGKKSKNPWFEGCVRITKSDDPNWLSDMECFARSDLVEVFSLKKEDGGLEGHNGRKEPSEGQVGIRCVFCKDLGPSERPSGCVTFPESVSSLHTKIGEMIRLHFPSCPSIPDEEREKFKSLKGFNAKMAGDDAEQYWVDSARDIGLCNLPSEGPYAGWGIAFRRDPLQPSPADDLDREMDGEEAPPVNSGALVRAEEDKGTCTDQVMLLLRNVKACRFKKSDRRGGPGSRGKDRVIGFPGLCCRHCFNSKNSMGRYFPVSAKNLTDSTANSLMVHVSSCSRCPEPIKASIAYLSHRGGTQKAELGGSWKKSFFKKVWDRLHVERAWEAEGDDDDKQEEDEGSGSEAEGGGGGDGSGTEDEELGEGMENLIAAAAIWLTEQETTDGGSRGRTARGRGLPNAKRPGGSPSKSSKGSGGSASKKRRL